MKVSILDRILAAVLLPPAAVLIGVIAFVVVPLQGGPFFYGAERMRAPGRAFTLWKIRTLEPSPLDRGDRILGREERGRITWAGRFLRATRLDELPQLWNVLRGDIAFIGPRPPLRRYVELYPALYSEILSRPPGITGLATVMLHRREAALLAGCLSAEETDRVYRTRCIPLKARLDLLYARRRSAALDALILWRTVSRLAPSRRRRQG